MLKGCKQSDLEIVRRRLRHGLQNILGACRMLLFARRRAIERELRRKELEEEVYSLEASAEAS